MLFNKSVGLPKVLISKNFHKRKEDCNNYLGSQMGYPFQVRWNKNGEMRRFNPFCDDSAGIKAHSVKTFVTFLLGINLLSLKAYATSYKTLPKGVKHLIYKYISTDSIGSIYGPAGSREPLYLKKNINSKLLENINTLTKAYFTELKRIDQKAYDQVSFGEYEGHATADIKVQGLGFAYGFTNRLTGYVAIPYYQAEVNIKINRTKNKNHDQVTDTLNKYSDKDDFALVLSQLTEDLPDANGGLLQSVLVNYFKYQPIGSWSGKGIGDLELAIIYRLTDSPTYGISLTTGAALPTGRIDDPDILQDIGFGDGQYDLFTGVSFGKSFLKGGLELNSSLRYTYQFPSFKWLRIPKSEGYTLKLNKDLFQEKLGNKIDFSIRTTVHPKVWLSTYLEYIANYKGESSYKSKWTEANRILSLKTESISQFIKFGTELSTVKLYLGGDFFLPGAVEASVQKMVSGKNTKKYTRYDLGLKFFF